MGCHEPEEFLLYVEVFVVALSQVATSIYERLVGLSAVSNVSQKKGRDSVDIYDIVGRFFGSVTADGEFF